MCIFRPQKVSSDIPEDDWFWGFKFAITDPVDQGNALMTELYDKAPLYGLYSNEPMYYQKITHAHMRDTESRLAPPRSTGARDMFYEYYLPAYHAHNLVMDRRYVWSFGESLVVPILVMIRGLKVYGLEDELRQLYVFAGSQQRIIKKLDPQDILKAHDALIWPKYDDDIKAIQNFNNFVCVAYLKMEKLTARYPNVRFFHPLPKH